MPVKGVSSYLRSLLLGTVFAALALAVTAGTVWTQARGETGDEFSKRPGSPRPSERQETVSQWSDTFENPIQHLTPIPPAAEGLKTAIEQTQGAIPFAPPPADPVRSGSGFEPMPETPPEPPVGNSYDDPLPEAAADQPLRDTTTEQDSIAIDADFAQQWQEDRDQIAVLRGRCRVVQGSTTLFGQKMVIWRRADASQSIQRERLIIYVEGDVLLDRPGQSISDQTMFLNLVTRNNITINAAHNAAGKPATEDRLYQRAKARMEAASRAVLDPTQLVVPNDGSGDLRSLQIPSPAGGFRRVRIFPRYGVPYNVLTFESQETTPPEQVWLLSGGINVLVDGVEGYGTVDLSADRVVIWTRQNQQDEFQAETVQSRDTPFQVYLEGNIVIRQGLNVLRANRAIYDAREDRALLLNAELRQYVPQLLGEVRVRAERMRQLNRDTFYAQNAWATTSKFGKPGYRIQSSDVFVEKRLADPWYLFGETPIDPATGRRLPREISWVTSTGNTFFVDDVPLFYLPRVSGPAEDPNIPIRRASISQDRIFGTQARVAWDLYQLLGIEDPPDGNWDLLTDYLSDRGPAIGTQGKYRGTDLLGLDGPFFGEHLFYYINDGGEDNLGLDRRRLEPEVTDRFRATLRHRQRLGYDLDLTAELGWISDRNFLEQYYENEFDRDKDQETLLYLRHVEDNSAITGLFRPQVNDFENTTEWLPKADYFVLSEPLFNGALTWSSHSSAGYGRLRRAERPDDPALDVFSPIPYIVNSEGAVFMSRHELDAPFNLGDVQFVPFALGEAAFWSEDIHGDSLDRLVGSLGIRSSIYAWRVFPYVHSRLFNVNGLAHKMVVESEYAYTDSSEPFSQIPQYNEIDDNSQERFRQRFPINTFGIFPPGNVAPMFDPRFYAIRAGAGRSVTDPYHELIDDQQVARLAWRHRLQTKVGPPERLRIKDWMTLDLEGSYFPDAQRDNFGEDVGLLGARYQWFIGDRTSFLASANYDVFDDAQQLWNLGVLSQRSERGSLYLGLRQVRGGGALDSQIGIASMSYQMSPKWVSTFGTAYDIKESRNVGQSLTVTRVGADFLVHLGANYDQSKDNAGFAIAVEPRLGALLSPTNLGSLLGSGFGR